MQLWNLLSAQHKTLSGLDFEFRDIRKFNFLTPQDFDLKAVTVTYRSGFIRIGYKVGASLFVGPFWRLQIGQFFRHARVLRFQGYRLLIMEFRQSKRAFVHHLVGEGDMQHGVEGISE